ncbi:MAG TPA: hypothetical protein VNK67_15055 [Burkholderiales bacterium]|nr:hypothetical protein [Burkholderiales bacterium]
MEQEKAGTSRDVNTVHAKPFAEMTFGEKLRHFCKVCLFFITFGFAYPNIFSE